MNKKIEFLDIIENIEEITFWLHSIVNFKYFNKAYLLMSKKSIDLWILKDDGNEHKEKVLPGTFLELLKTRNEINGGVCEDSLWKIVPKEGVDFTDFLKFREDNYGIDDIDQEPWYENNKIMDTYKATTSFSVYDANIGSTKEVLKNDYIMNCGDNEWIIIPAELPKVIYVMGQSNTGKDTMRNCFFELVKNDFCNFEQKYHMIVSHTDRPMRENEVHRETYIFHMPGDRETLRKEFESDYGDIIALSSFKVANDDWWNYWDSYCDLRHDKINIMIGDNVKCSQLLKQESVGRLRMRVIKLTCPDTILLARATKRSSTEALKNDEMIRRLSADMEAYSEENLNSLGITDYKSVDTSGPDAFKNFLLAIDELSK